ncbi:unnamed protein product [Fraxinus pennsylvanica]|uniref:PIFI-like Ig-like domain-containing protein n=1 Tax=Fraxinus pennsylvanica TaxID=56036 RepID=A0AAD1Z5S8_9LAMI|nr:unnamed protein product [Fraxinus pennsylvanica]
MRASAWCSNIATTFMGTPLQRFHSTKRKLVKVRGKIFAAAAVPVATAPVVEVKKYVLPTWAEFDLGRAPVYWKTMNDYGIAFNGGFNQPIMCGGEPRVMLNKVRGKADPRIYTIQICIPKHAVRLIFSFTNGTNCDGPYRLQFQVPRAWRNKTMDFFTVELSKEGACERAIFPDTSIIATRCAIIGDRCNLDLVPGCTDPSSPMYNLLSNVDDGSCPPCWYILFL